MQGPVIRAILQALGERVEAPAVASARDPPGLFGGAPWGRASGDR